MLSDFKSGNSYGGVGKEEKREMEVCQVFVLFWGNLYILI